MPGLRNRLVPQTDLFKQDGLSESRHQIIVFQWADYHKIKFPELRWLHASNQGATYGSNERERQIRGAQMKRQGLKPGVSDLCLPVKRSPYSGLYIELKKTGGKASPEQRDFGEFVTEQGFRFAVCEGWKAAVDEIERYLDGRHT